MALAAVTVLAFMFGYLVRADKGRYENAIEQGIVAAMLAVAVVVEMLP